MSIKFFEYWANGQPYNHEYADLDESELERLIGGAVEDPEE